MLVADCIADRLVREGVRHVFGVGGANIEDVFAAVQRRRPAIRVVLGKHEHAGATAADAYARLSGRLGVVLATSGGGTMNLVHAIAEARASRVPVLAIVGEPPTDVQGRGAFQDTSGQGDAIDAAEVFRAVASFAARAPNAAAVPALFDDAVDAAFARRGPAVLLVAKDRQQADIGDFAARPKRDARALAPEPPVDARLLRAAVALLDSGPVVLVAGDCVARSGACDELARLADRLDARVAVTPDARDAFDNDAPRFAGVVGAMGHAEAARAVAEARACVLVGTRLPLLARQGIEASLREKRIVTLHPDPPYVSSRESVHVAGDTRALLRALLAALGPHEGAALATRATASVDAIDASVLRPASVLAALDRALPDGAVLIADAGNTGASAVHHVRCPRGGRWLLAMGMAGMGYAFGAAIGAACATGRRVVAVAGDGAFYMHGLDIHTAVEHALPITYVILDNRAHGMCLVRERLLLNENAGYNAFRASHLGAGLAAMFPRLDARDCATLADVERALAESFARPGPSAIVAELPEVDVPPFAAFQRSGAERVASVSRGAVDEDP